MISVTDNDLPGWTFDIHERSAGVYEGTGTHVQRRQRWRGRFRPG